METTLLLLSGANSVEKKELVERNGIKKKKQQQQKKHVYLCDFFSEKYESFSISNTLISAFKRACDALMAGKNVVTVM